MNKKVKITISGVTGSGKSRIAYLIKEVLKNKGFNIEHNFGIDFDDENQFDNTMSKNIDSVVENISKNRTIIIEEIAINKTEQEGPFNGHAPEKIKERISKEFNCKIEDIKFFGSRVIGNYKKDSDLDVAILDDKRVGEDLIYKTIFSLNCEIRFVEDLNLSWLRDSI